MKNITALSDKKLLDYKIALENKIFDKIVLKPSKVLLERREVFSTILELLELERELTLRENQ